MLKPLLGTLIAYVGVFVLLSGFFADAGHVMFASLFALPFCLPLFDKS